MPAFSLERNQKSHKGQNGKVLVIGGNEIFHGAPLLTALGAEKSGADLIFVCLPPQHATVARQVSLNFIVNTFKEAHLTPADIPVLLQAGHDVDVTILGNGLGHDPQTQKALKQFLREHEGLVVIDADALLPDLLQMRKPYQWILTPHDEEFRRVFGQDPTPDHIQSCAQERQCVIVKKGHTDILANTEGKIKENRSGHPGMTVGGTGDALAGIIGGFIAQGLAPFEACYSATQLWGACGEHMGAKQKRFSAQELLQLFPTIL